MSTALSQRCKVVVRNLPPTLAADAFQGFIDKHFEGTYNWLAYYQGKVSLKRTVFSRAFINFHTSEGVLEFKARFDGHVFVSTRGTQYRCSVEYAPFQKVPTVNPKKLAMEGTIEKDPDYQAFLQSLEEGPKALPTATAQLEAAEAARAGEEAAPVVTALMAFLQKKYESQPFTGRRGSKASRRRELPSVSEDKPGKGKAAKGSRSSRAAAASDAAAAAAAAAGAVEKALKGTRPKPSNRHKLDDAAADEPGPSSRARRQPAAKGSGSRAKDARDSSAEAAADRPRGGRQSSKRAAAVAAPASAESCAAASKEKAAAAVAAEDESAKRTAAAALAASSAANAAAAAARKARVRQGHMVYTPGAGGRLLAAALPKAAGAAGTEAAEAAAAGSGSAAGTSGKEKGEKGQARERGTGGGGRPARRGGKSAAGSSEAGAGDDSAPAGAAVAALERLHIGDGADSSSSRRGGGRGGGRKGGRGAAGSPGQAGTPSQLGKQQQWVAKSGSAG